jgi:hypothetical protein
MTEPESIAYGRKTLLFVENQAPWEPQKTRDRRLDGELQVQHVENGVVLPIVSGSNGKLLGGVVRPDGTYIQTSRHLQNAGDLNSAANVVGGYDLNGPPTKRHGTVIYAGGGGKVRAYGHFLIEDLSRLWYLFKNPEYQDLPVVYINPKQNIDDAGFRLLEIAGISREQIIILDEPTAFDNVIVPEQSLFLHPGSLHFAESKRTYDTIRDGVTPGSYDKIYLTYRHKNRTQLSVSVNEEMLEDLYQRNGFTVIAPEKLCMREQISVISGAKEIACTAGTLSHLIAFAQDSVTLDVFVRDKNYIPEIQWSLNEMRLARVNVVDTLLPVISGNARRGVIYFTSTPQWARFARARFNSVEPSEPPHDYVESYLREWAQLLANSRKWALDLMPEWRASDLVESIYNTLLPFTALSAEQKSALKRRFYASEQRIKNLESQLRGSDAADGEQIRELERRLDAIEASFSWRVTRPLRATVSWLTCAYRNRRPTRR